MDQRVSEERRDSHGPSGSLFRGFRSQTGSPHLISPMSSTLSSVEQPLGSKAEHGSISSATLSDQPADRETSGSPIPISPTSLAFDSTDIGEFSDGGYEGQNDDYSEYSVEIPHDLGDAGTYRHHGGNSGDAKRRGNSVSTNQKRLRDGPSSQDDEDDDNPPKKPSKRQKVEGIKGKTTGNCKKPFACPYFKRSQYLCPRWKGRNVQEVINHCTSQHLQLWCPRCKEFRTDNQNAMNRHLANDNCLYMAPGDDYLRNEVNTDIRDELFRYRSPKICTWQGVYRILFHRDKPTIPDGFWYDAEARTAETFGNPSLRLSQCVPIPLDKQSGYQSGLAKTLACRLELDEDYLKKIMIEFNTEWAASNSNQIQSPGIGGSETNPRDINNDAIASGIPSGVPQPTTTEQAHNPIVSGFPSGIPSGNPQPTAPEQTHNPIVSDINPLQCITTTLNQQYNPNHPAVSIDGPAAGPFDALRAGAGEMRPATTPDENHLQPVARTTLEQGNDLISAQDPGPSVCNIQPWALDISPFLFSGSPNFDYLPE